LLIEMCRSLGENLFPELACSTAPLFREPEKSLVSSEARQGDWKQGVPIEVAPFAWAKVFVSASSNRFN
jgi:hypothetical protein